MGAHDPWVQTNYGVDFQLLEVSPNNVRSKDIAWALGGINRYNAHTNFYYSVAEHCSLISDYLLRTTGDPMVALAGLLHDAHEAYTGDMTSPMQNAMEILVPGFKKAFRALQARIDKAILRALDLDEVVDLYAPIIAECDLRIVTDEQNQAMRPSPFPDNAGWPSKKGLGVTLQFWSRERASREWHDRLCRLHNKRPRPQGE